jgi:group I intron endonuclease
MKRKVAGIYWIKNLINGKIYVGSTICFKKRFREHKKYLKEKAHKNLHLQNAWNKYGEENFIFEVLEKLENNDELIKREQFFIDKLNPEYNICKIAGNCLGVKRTEETKNKYSGENHYFTKLNWEKVNRIRTEYLGTKNITILKLSEKYNVSYFAIASILQNKYWKDKNYIPLEKGDRKKKIEREISCETALEIRKLYTEEGYSQNELAKKYELKRNRIVQIIRNKVWTSEDYTYFPKNIKKLTIEQVSEIKEKYKPYKYTVEQLAEEYKVSTDTIGRILRNETYNKK